jgi:glutamate carboxypeptidase
MKNSSRSLFRRLKSEQKAMTATLGRYVNFESPSGAPEPIAALAAEIATDFAAIGGRVRLHRLKDHGPALQVDFPGPRRSPHLLLLGHMDTVYPLGTLRTMPWREKAGKLYGPGVFDMKSGIVQALFALRALLAMGPAPCYIRMLLVPDEEIGSPASQPLTAKFAQQADTVLVLEPAAGPEGACKTSRKGVGRYTLRITGRAAHAGLDFERGASAIVEAARQVESVHALCQPQKGLTLNPGLIAGGTRPNVVAEQAEIVVDLRFFTVAQARRADAALHRLKPHDPRCTLELTGGVERWAFERSPATVRLYRVAQKAARGVGFELAEKAVGGGSDGNFTAALGVPTLDGLGGVGDGAHAPHEFVFARELPCRAAMLAGLITALAAGEGLARG